MIFWYSIKFKTVSIKKAISKIKYLILNVLFFLYISFNLSKVTFFPFLLKISLIVEFAIRVITIPKIIPTNIFSSEYLKKIEGIPYKNTKFKMLLELLKKAIKAYSKTNQVKAIEFSKRMKTLVDKYNNRDATILVSNDEVINEFIDGLSEEARKILEDIQKDANEFKNLGISFEEKAFYDILKAIRDKYKFEYDDKRLITLSKKVKEVVDDKSKYIDWSSRADIKAAFQSDIIRLLNKNGYPPQTFEDVYNKVLAQVENFKKYQNQA